MYASDHPIGNQVEMSQPKGCISFLRTLIAVTLSSAVFVPLCASSVRTVSLGLFKFRKPRIFWSGFNSADIKSCASLVYQVSGSKFYYLKNEAVLLEMGLTNWAISEVMKKGFTPLITPEIVRSSVVEKCGFQPRGTNTQVYSIDGSDQCLIGTAEIPVGGIHMDSILPDSALPLKYVAYSHCFRTEAGAAGTATK
ncbi:hypothetical protein IFM89_004091 [Coptis chinensis]|uniref:Uncharacterized protein n=1 Tax=Coptis chinensis TaxID=261450 RepID=A0A835MHA3_9MAGN|nr:hypothetical protein IFM89_004091 [Coptis chinensis]